MFTLLHDQIYFSMFQISREHGAGKRGLHGLEEGRALLRGACVERRPAETKKAIVGGVGGEFRGDGLRGFDRLGGRGYGPNFD